MVVQGSTVGAKLSLPGGAVLELSGDNKAFSNHTEFLDDLDGYDSYISMREWKHSSCIPEFDPTAFLTLTAPEDESVGEIKARHAEAGRHFPAIIASSLSKPLVYASKMGIEFLLTCDLKRKGKVAEQVHSVVHDSVKIDFDITTMFSLLMHHHKREDCEIVVTPLTGKEMKDILKWTQTRVSNAINGLMPLVRGFDYLNGMNAYKSLCESPDLDRELTRLYTKLFEPQLKEIAHGDLDHHYQESYRRKGKNL